MQFLDLSSKPRVKGARHWAEPINQLYHPTGIFDQDSQDVIYSFGNLNSTKFVPILLKEWFYLLKKGGYLVVDYKPNKLCGFQKLEEQMWWLWKMKYDIYYHGPIGSKDVKNLKVEKIAQFVERVPSQPITPTDDESYFRFVCRKLESTQAPGDDINKWTFGMITKGERDSWIEEIIQAIHKQRIPHYEIIVCGTYRDRKEKNFKYIPFNKRDDRGWITKKKNLIAKVAKYENLCFIHDRIVLDEAWFKGMRKYGNCFELLCNSQVLREEEIRAGDWLTYGNNKLGMPFGISLLDYNDWDEYIYMSGQLSIWKKSIWEKCPWNETLYWGEEDVELTFRARDLGYLARFNSHSSVTALAWRFGRLPSKYYFSQGFLPKDMLVRRLLRFGNKVLFSIPVLRKISSPAITYFMQSRLYKFLTSR